MPDCLSQNLTYTPTCSIPKNYPFYNPGGIPQEQQAAASTGAGYVDTDPWFCISSTCTSIVGNILVYRDDNHITATYASWLTPAVGRRSTWRRTGRSEQAEGGPGGRRVTTPVDWSSRSERSATQTWG